ncbi:MAG: hypothetical protein ACD_46C00690G0003 [uncultured bacterium]|nr:MAG: hypothetical protein ACD_46C00690G0003 [uncultured bacterium]
MKKLLFTLSIITFFWAIPTLAVKVSSLYQADMPVATQLEDARSEAVRQGFIHILVKLSGNPDIAENPLIKENVKKAEYYVQEYSYAQPTTTSSMYMLQIRYDKDDINNLLRKAGVVYWGETRPLVLVWVTVADGTEAPEIIGSEEADEWYDTFRQQGKKYGLPLIFPVMDVTDINKVSPHDVNTMNITTLKQAGMRYSPDALLIGKIEKDKNGGWKGQWRLILDENQWDWRITGNDMDMLLGDTLNQVSHTLSKQLVVKNPGAPVSWVKLQVSHVTRGDDLDQLMQFLRQLSPVQQVELSQVDGDVVELAVQVHGNLATFQQNVNIGQRLEFKSLDKQMNKLVYEWKR